MKKGLLFLALSLTLPIHGIEQDSDTKKRTLSRLELIGGIATALLVPVLGCVLKTTHFTKSYYDRSLVSQKDVFNNGAPLSGDKHNEYMATSYSLRSQSRILHVLLAGTLVALGFIGGRISTQLCKKPKKESVSPKTS